MEQVRRRGLIGRVLRSSAAWAGILAMANLACTGTARADVASEMNSFFSDVGGARSEEHTSELQSLMRISYAVFCLKKKKYFSKINQAYHTQYHTHLYPDNKLKHNNYQ